MTLGKPKLTYIALCGWMLYNNLGFPPPPNKILFYFLVNSFNIKQFSVLKLAHSTHIVYWYCWSYIGLYIKFKMGASVALERYSHAAFRVSSSASSEKREATWQWRLCNDWLIIFLVKGGVWTMLHGRSIIALTPLASASATDSLVAKWHTICKSCWLTVEWGVDWSYMLTEACRLNYQRNVYCCECWLHASWSSLKQSEANREQSRKFMLAD